MKLGAIEAGGTKFVLAVGDEEGNILDRCSIPTTTPSETMNLVLDYFNKNKVEAIGLGSIGPNDPKPIASTLFLLK